MANTRYDRHCELWREHDKQVGRWIIGAVVFAIVLQHKVLIPFTEIPRQKARLEAKLAGFHAELEATRLDREGFKKSEDRLAEIKTVVKQAPWAEERNILRGSFLNLQRYAQIVRGMPRAKLLARMDATDESASRPQSPLLFPGQSPPANSPSSGPLNVGQFPPSPDLPFANLPVMQALPNTAGIGDINESEMSQSQAIFALGLDREAVEACRTHDDLTALIEGQKRKVGQQLADAAVERVAEMVDGLVIAPLEALPGEMPEVAKLRSDIHKWEQEHLGQPQWYQTVPSKGATIDIVGNQANAQTDALMQALEAKQKRVEERIATLAAAELASKQDIEKLDAQCEKLQTRLQRLLPEWLQELVSADQMLELYPLALVGLLVAIGTRAFLVRSHYTVVRSGHELPELSADDPAVSSLWTLVYRGPTATLITAGAYLGAIGIVCWYFDSGCRLLADWLTTEHDTVWGLVTQSTSSIRVFGHLAFASAALLILTVLIRDRSAMTKARSINPSSFPQQHIHRRSDVRAGH